MTVGIALMTSKFEKNGECGFPDMKIIKSKKKQQNHDVKLRPNNAAKVLTKLAMVDTTLIIASLAIGILGALSMLHVLSMPSEMIYAFGGVGLVMLPFAGMLIKDIFDNRGMSKKHLVSKELKNKLKMIPKTIAYAFTPNQKG